MDKKCQIKFIHKSAPNTIIFKSYLSELTSFDLLKKKIIEKSKTLKNIGVFSENDKLFLEIEGYQIDSLNGIWNQETFRYFFEIIQKDPPLKLKLVISKIDKEPIFKKPKYLTVFKESLKSAWASTKKEIENELTEKYLNEGKRYFDKDIKENELELNEELFNKLHVNVICNNCFTSNFNGARYMCCECDNFNLCEFCQKNAHIAHKPEHTFIKFNTPVEQDIQKYNCIFSPNKILLKQKLDPFELDITIINNGEIDLKGCFFSSIRFGNKYLGCIKQSIVEKCEKGGKVTLKNVIIKFDEDELEENINNIYEGYFRLMTIEGVPFGDIFYIKFIVEE
jgi:hypothetical protein